MAAYPPEDPDEYAKAYAAATLAGEEPPQDETAHLLSSPENARRLLSAIERLETAPGGQLTGKLGVDSSRHPGPPNLRNAER